MITSKQLTEVIERQLESSTRFLVYAEVLPNGKAVVEVDDDAGHITLAALTEVNHALRDAFGDALDDLELEVSSPGAGRPFRIRRQYHKHVGMGVEVELVEGGALAGELMAVSEQGISLVVEHPSKVKGRAPKRDEEPTEIPFDRIKTTQAIIKFN